MSYLPLVPKDCQPPGSRSQGRPEIRLPTFYMEDHSRMGLVVEPYVPALDLLGDHAVLHPQAGGWAQLKIEGAAHLNSLLGLLERHGLTYELTDLVDQVYQG